MQERGRVKRENGKKSIRKTLEREEKDKELENGKREIKEKEAKGKIMRKVREVREKEEFEERQSWTYKTQIVRGTCTPSSCST